ncbi:uncharacterized protein LOC135834677 [Planococcus citri]|uniref:uncharacterized protein LOC135834677 n=1 Tax=Planococcus citri TaxID=170843 RepID=UPI0031F7B8B2
MAVKVIGVCLMLSCIFLCALGNLKITKEDFANFEGTDPTKFCGNKKNMEKFCRKIIKEDIGESKDGPFMKGYPKCQSSSQVKVVKKCGKGTDTVSAKILICHWDKEDECYTYSKGQKPNTVTVLAVNDGICTIWKQLPYTGN